MRNEVFESGLARNLRTLRLQSMACAVASDPLQFCEDLPEGRSVQEYREVREDSRFGVENLAKLRMKARRKLRKNRRRCSVRALAFKEYRPMRWRELNATGWLDALSKVVRYVAETHPEVVSLLMRQNLMGWVRKTNSNESMIVCCRKGSFTLLPMDDAASYQWVQCLFLLCGIRLTDVAVCYERRDVNSSGKRLRPDSKNLDHKETPLSIEQARYEMCMKEVRKIKRTQNRLLRQIEAARKRSKVGESVSYVSNAMTASKADRKTPYATSRPDGFLIASDGVVVGRTLDRRVEGHGDSAIVRSKSDSEDTWKGFGHIARDNGRYGSIDGVDYAD